MYKRVATVVASTLENVMLANEKQTLLDIMITIFIIGIQNKGSDLILVNAFAQN